MAREDIPLVIEAAINGETQSDRNPNTPRKPEEISTQIHCFVYESAIIFI